MSLFDKLLKKLKKDQPNTNDNDKSKIGNSFKDIIFDWFNTNNDSVENFVSEFLDPCIAVYSKDANNKHYLENYPDKAYESYFNRHAIIYLAAKYPDNDWFKKLFNFLMNKENREAYSIKDAIRKNSYLHTFIDESPELINTLIAGEVIIKCYHALYDNRDSNISYLSSIPYQITSALNVKLESAFEKIIRYINLQETEGVLYIISNSISNYSIENVSQKSVDKLNEVQLNKLQSYNSKNFNNISHELAIDFNNTILSINRSKVYQETEYKKRKYLSLKDFPEITNFLDKYSKDKAALIEYYIYNIGRNYLSKDFLKIHKGIVNTLCKGTVLNKSESLSILDTTINSNLEFLHNSLLSQLIDNSAANQNDFKDIVDRFEIKLLQDIEHQMDTAKFQISFDVITKNRKSQDPIQQSITNAKYNGIYGDVDFQYNWISININDKKQGEASINAILKRLNTIFPCSLKHLARMMNHIHNEMTLAKINIDGTDYEFTLNIIRELNDILSAKQTGYRLLPILIKKRKDSKHRKYGESNYKCSIELLNFEQYKYYKKHVLKDDQLINSNLIRNIIFLNHEAKLITIDEINSEESNQRLSFENDPSWKWFKDQYVDKLESADKWYNLIDILSRCKGASKPNKEWVKDINLAIVKFGKDRYFKELGVMISNSLKETFWFVNQYKTTIKGILWSCMLNPTDESLSIIQSVIVVAYTKIPGIGPKSTALGNVGLNALVLSKDDRAFGIMNLMRNKSKYQRFIKAIDKYSDKFLETADGNPEELADKSIPDFGFTANSKTITINSSISAIFLIKNLKLSKKWTIDGKLQTSMPSIVKEEYKTQEKEIAAEFKRINLIYKQLKDRVKTYWLYNRKWDFALWQESILNHNLLNSYLTNMIWSNETNQTTFIYRNEQMIDNEGKEVISASTDIISLWHPATSNVSEIKKWQNFIFSHKIIQPLRQAYREHYPFSDTEANGTSSERFTHHFLKVRSLMAIANSAAWIFTYEHEGLSWPRKYIKPLDITVHLKCDYNRNDFAIPTKELYFTQGNSTKLNYKNETEKIVIKSIPAKTRSELCRDMDLFIATTSIANDPELSLKSEDQKFYREDFHQGHFSDNASAKIRKQIIETISPNLGILPTFDKNYLIVEGKLKTYRINLGSGFAQLADSQKHINLLPDIQPMKKSKKIHTPIQDDETLYVILAKVKHLKDDDKISDEKFIEAINS